MTEEGKRVQQLIQAIRDECEAIQRIVQKLKDSQKEIQAHEYRLNPPTTNPL